MLNTENFKIEIQKWKFQLLPKVLVFFFDKGPGRIWPTHLIFFIARFSLDGSNSNLVQTLPNWDGFIGKIDLKSILKLFRTVFLVFWEDDELKCLFRNSIFIFSFCVHILHYQLVGNTIFELKTTFKLSISTNYSFSE